MKFICILLPISTSPLMKSITLSESAPAESPYRRGFSYSHILLTDSLTISGELFA